jgi:zinc transport system substrate-binding protein
MLERLIVLARRRSRVLLSVAFSMLCGASALAAEKPAALRVFVSVAPQKTFVEKVGGQHVAVRLMVPSGRGPATYEPTVRQVAALAAADLYVRTGVPFENAWMARIRAANPDMPVIDNRDGLALRDLEEHEHEQHHHAQAGADKDAHIWTSPLNVERIARQIRDKLSELDPAREADYAANYQAFAAELAALDKAIRQRLSGLKDRRFMVFHPAWGYFADAYGLQQVAIEHEGKEPGARALAAVIEQARAAGIKVIFVQPQFHRKSAEQVARAIGGRVEALDPLALDYVANLRRVADALAGGQ